MLGMKLYAYTSFNGHESSLSCDLGEGFRSDRPILAKYGKQDNEKLSQNRPGHRRVLNFSSDCLVPDRVFAPPRGWANCANWTTGQTSLLDTQYHHPLSQLWFLYHASIFARQVSVSLQAQHLQQILFLSDRVSKIQESRQWEIWNKLALLITVIILLSIEWFIRKKKGML